MVAGGNNTIQKSVKKLARTLLATTCLTVASGVAARADIITEGTPPAPTDFPNASASAFVLPSGASIVNGTIDSLTDQADWVEFINLPGGVNFTLNATALSGSFANVEVLDDTLATIVGPTSFGPGSPADLGPAGIPADGNLIVGVLAVEGSTSYSLTLDPPSGAPEPATFGSVGLALAGAFAWRRKRNR